MKSTFDERKTLSPTVGLPMELYRQGGPGKAAAHRNNPVLAHLLKDFLKKDQIPVPDTADREGYQGPHHFDYWLSGLSDYWTILEHVGSLPEQAHIVDFGGASGRIARFFSNASTQSRVTVAELNVNHVDFITRYFPENTRAIKLSSLPYFMFAENECDLIYAFSVFTHIDVYELSWLAEIRRILKPGGKAYLTIHDETSWLNLEKMPVYRVLLDSPDFARHYVKDAPMPEERLVYEYNTSSNEYNCNVFHHSDYIRRVWSKWLKVVEILPGIHGHQSAVVLEKV